MSSFATSLPEKQKLSFLVLKGDDAYLAGELSKCRDIQVFLALKSKKVQRKHIV
jgi:hypothetical protein